MIAAPPWQVENEGIICAPYVCVTERVKAGTSREGAHRAELSATNDGRDLGTIGAPSDTEGVRVGALFA